jgi:hypothetical protein
MTVLTVANALRRHPMFRKTSLRHLTDLVERARGGAKLIPFDGTERINAVFVLVLRGTALANGKFPVMAGDLFSTGLVQLITRAGLAFMLRATRAATTLTLEDVHVDVEGTAAEGTLLLPFTSDVLLKATQASTSFGLSVDLEELAGRPLTLHEAFTTLYGTA